MYKNIKVQKFLTKNATLIALTTQRPQWSSISLSSVNLFLLTVLQYKIQRNQLKKLKNASSELSFYSKAKLIIWVNSFYLEKYQEIPTKNMFASSSKLRTSLLHFD